MGGKKETFKLYIIYIIYCYIPNLFHYSRFKKEEEERKKLLNVNCNCLNYRGQLTETEISLNEFQLKWPPADVRTRPLGLRVKRSVLRALRCATVVLAGWETPSILRKGISWKCKCVSAHALILWHALRTRSYSGGGYSLFLNNIQFCIADFFKNKNKVYDYKNVKMDCSECVLPAYLQKKRELPSRAETSPRATLNDTAAGLRQSWQP